MAPYALLVFVGFIFVSFTSCLVSGAAASCSSSSDPLLMIRRETMDGPNQTASMALWQKAIHEWRDEVLASLQLNTTAYDLTSQQWVAINNTMQTLVMAHESTLYDGLVTHAYNVSGYLSDLRARYGGIDSVLYWATYPNIGVDDRNQFEMFQSLPGFPDAVEAMVEAFQAEGVRFLIPYNPWDTGTNPPLQSDEDMLSATLSLIGGDGFNGDTMAGIPSDFFFGSANGRFVDEPEMGATNDCASLATNTATWGEFWDWPQGGIPPVSKYKFLEPRHMVHLVARWNRNHQWELQWSWFNGIGFVAWENVWGIFLQVTQQDGETIRRLHAMSTYLAPQLRQADRFIPHSGETLQTQVYASRFDVGPQTTPSSIVWTLVSTAQEDLNSVAQLLVPFPPTYLFFDVYHGVQIEPIGVPQIDQTTGEWSIFSQLNFSMEASGYGGVVAFAGVNELPPDLPTFLSTMANMTAKPLSSYSSTPVTLTQAVAVNARVAPPRSGPPAGMVLVTGPTSPLKYIFNVSGIELEGGDTDPGVDVQYDVLGETMPYKHHILTIDILDFYMDVYPVTNAQFLTYLQSADTTPLDSPSCFNLLRDWQWSWASGTDCTSPADCSCANIVELPSFPTGWENKPVTWIGLDEARAYCAWYGKRLPEEWEWQYAAQGGNPDNVYPWGPAADSTRLPPPCNQRVSDAPYDVDAFASNGTSKFGIADLVGNVWQWTSEFRDAHTRRATIKGGSRYYPKGTQNWYFPNTQQLNVHGQLLLMDHTMDRSGWIGFRCIQDNTDQSIHQQDIVEE